MKLDKNVCKWKRTKILCIIVCFLCMLNTSVYVHERETWKKMERERLGGGGEGWGSWCHSLC